MDIENLNIDVSGVISSVQELTKAFEEVSLAAKKAEACIEAMKLALKNIS